MYICSDKTKMLQYTNNSHNLNIIKLLHSNNCSNNFSRQTIIELYNITT